MTKVVINKVYAYIWAGKASDHKQGKLPENVLLNLEKDEPEQGRYELDPEHTKAIIEIYDPLRDSDYDLYSAFWIDQADVVTYIPVPDPPTPVPEPEGCLTSLFKRR